MFIQTETTPDPERMKFLPGCEVLSQGTIDLRDRAQASASPLAERLFAIPGVASVSFNKDTITVTKANGDWQHLKPGILGAIMEHFRSGAPVLRAETEAGTGASPLPPAGTNSDTIDLVREALRRVIDPELGYNIVDLGLIYDVASEGSGMMRITMTTTTPGCPATNYLKAGAGEAASDVPGVDFVEVALTYEPRWSPEMMSAEAKAHFGITDGGGR
jgi:metal-sulfur cluster biosynthetic enzyme